MDEELPLSIGDSAVVSCDMDASGGLAEVYCEPAGEMRPALRMWYRVVDGPNYGDLFGDTGDPLVDPQADGTPTDGLCYSPWMGVEEFPGGSGEFWNVVQADSARNAGEENPARDRYAFDLNDMFFEPGDLIEYFFEGFSVEGHHSTLPPYAMSSDPDLREVFTLRCLPRGNQILMVMDGEDVWFPWREAILYHCGSVYDERYVTWSPAAGLNNGLASRAKLEDLSYYEIIVWDSGDVASGTLCDEDDKTRDDLLLEAWLRNATHQAHLWVLGDHVANDLGMGDPFLDTVLGTELLEEDLFYGDLTGIAVPTVLGTHDYLQYLGGDPEFWVFGGESDPGNFSLVSPLGGLSETLQDWEVDTGNGAVAGIVNRDPDGDGTQFNAQGVITNAIFNPWTYRRVRDKGYGLIADECYARKLVDQIFSVFFYFDPG